MLKAKINNVARLLKVMADPTTISMPQKAVLANAARQLEEAARQAGELEAMVVPKTQRLQLQDLASGKVTMFPIVARPEAQA